MSKSDTFENDLLKIIFNAAAIANLMDNAASLPHANLALSLHSADPGETGTQNTSEIAYTGYTRILLVRTSGGWTVTTNSVSPVANIDFPAGTGGSGTVTHAAVGVGIVASVTCTNASPGVFTDTAHGMPVNTPVALGGTAVPTGFTAGTIYYVTAANLAANTYSLSATPGGAAINTSSTGTAVSAFKAFGASKILYSGTVTPNIVTGNGVTPRLTTASTVTED
jgi:hypothetical protein